MHNLRFTVLFLLSAGSIWIRLTVKGIPIDWQSSTVISTNGLQFSPVDQQALFLSNTTAKSLFTCTRLCHSNRLCRIFDYDRQSQRCRLFQGNITTMGSIVPSPSTQSYVGSVRFRPEHFLNIGQPCSVCQGSRYMRCLNGTCQCLLFTYYDGIICQSEKLLGGDCNNSSECRSDLNYTCLPRMQCDSLSVQSGVLVGGYGNGSAGNDLYGLRNPMGMSIDNSGSIYVSEYNNARVMRFSEGSLMGFIAAGTGIVGSSNAQLNRPAATFLDASSNLYITDSSNARVMLWHKNATTGIVVAGNSISANGTTIFTSTSGLAIDSLGNMYISDYFGHHAVKWIVNTNNSIFITGTGSPGSGSHQLNQPYGVHFDELNSYLYIADTLNHRIQRFHVGVSMNGTTVAGGNGPGTGNHQLNTPYDICISKKTGAMYIADFNNHRVQRWNPGATSGVTIVGTTGVSGTSSTLLDGPSGVMLNDNETYLYVSEMNNNRIQRFQLI